MVQRKIDNSSKGSQAVFQGNGGEGVWNLLGLKDQDRMECDKWTLKWI
jgi:hypothetical protein